MDQDLAALLREMLAVQRDILAELRAIRAERAGRPAPTAPVPHAAGVSQDDTSADPAVAVAEKIKRRNRDRRRDINFFVGKRDQE